MRSCKAFLLFVVLLIMSVLFILTGCGGNNSNVESSKGSVSAKPAVNFNNLNVSILLDLSDRIDPVVNPNAAMDYYKRDLGYIESISKSFEKHILSKPVIKIDDQIQLYFDPEPMDPEINSLANKLRLSFTKANATKESIREISSTFTSVTGKIYEAAIKDRKYVGADIWGFFKQKVKDYCIKPNHRNILFIFTDGYMFHQHSKFIEKNRSTYLTPKLIKTFGLQTSKYREHIQSKGYGFIKAIDGLEDLEVVVLGINPSKETPFEGDVINLYWTNWLMEMNVRQPLIEPFAADLPSHLDPIIRNYINR